MSKKIPLSRGLSATVDDHNFEWLNQWKWSADKEGYAVRSDYSSGKAKQIRMHRLVTGCPKGKQVDHINGEVADNREGNLRICSAAENSRSRKLSKSGSKGISWARRQRAWKATIGVRGNIFLGYFKDKDQALAAYDRAAKKHHGAFAKLNSAGGGACASS